MKKISMLLVLLVILPAGYLFSAPPPEVVPWPPHKPKPFLKGHWEGTGNFLLTDQYGTRTEEAEVLLDITNQDGNKFLGNITARYLSPEGVNFVFIGGDINVPVAGSIQGDSASLTRPVSMLSGFGGVYSPMCVTEIDGQYESKNVLHPQVTLTCRWRGIRSYQDDIGNYQPIASVGEFTVTLQQPPSPID